MCLGKQFKKEEYEKIDERRKCWFKSCILKAETIEA